MRSLLVAVILCLPFSATAEDPKHSFSLESFGDGLYAIELDSTGTKSTMFETSDSLYLLEVALSDQGGGAKEIVDHHSQGQALLNFITERFANKPLAAVLHSHWHPHSISSVAPFLEAGIPIYTTQANFSRIKHALDSSLVSQSTELIRFVESDSVVVGGGDDPIIVYRVDKETYRALPSSDYLYFYLPQQNILHCGCMYNRWPHMVTDGRPILTTRQYALHQFTSKKSLPVEGLIRLYMEDSSSQVQPYNDLLDIIENGITVREIVAPFREMTADSLRHAREEIMNEVIRRTIPASLFNSLAYRALTEQDLAKAKEFAFIQALCNPSDPNAWDTLGEIYFYLGDSTMARAYEKQSREIDPEFDSGGMEVWKENLAGLQKRWSEGDN